MYIEFAVKWVMKSNPTIVFKLYYNLIQKSFFDSSEQQLLSR